MWFCSSPKKWQDLYIYRINQRIIIFEYSTPAPMNLIATFVTLTLLSLGSPFSNDKNDLGRFNITIPSITHPFEPNDSTTLAAAIPTSTSRISMPNTSPEPPEFNQTKEVQDLLECWFGHLKSFIHESHFDTFSFIPAAEILSDGLGGIVSLAGEVLYRNAILSQQLAFIKTVYNTMVLASAGLQFYENVGISENYLLSCMLDLNVRLLGLCNSQGMLDTSILGYPERILIIWNTLTYWKRSFGELHGVSDHIRKLFDDQTVNAEERLLKIWGQIPKR
ncbi:hypothetical protein JCM33374_g4225 [Metschnikowia sp. JCM 33374]|nr:hypothetical protein JCM33374_g4225 [Metschnikowia sp. JCM 33374]